MVQRAHVRPLIYEYFMTGYGPETSHLSLLSPEIRLANITDGKVVALASPASQHSSAIPSNAMTSSNGIGS